jgi:exodeoxyribonuclease VII large subunit
MRELLRGLVDPRREMERQFQRLDELDRRVKRAMIQVFNRELMQWESIDRRLLYLSPLERLIKQRHEMNQRYERLSQQMGMGLQLRQKLLEKWVGKLDALSPFAILDRGYSIARRLPLMTLIKDAGDLQRGDLIHLTLHRGALVSRIEEVK